MPVAKRSFGERPRWAPRQVDAAVVHVHPLQGQVLLEEMFPETRIGGLEVIRSQTVNTVVGKILALHPETALELGVAVGDTVIFREWQGGRWAFNGQSALLTESKDILAQVAPD